MALVDKYGKAISNTTKRYVSRAEPKTASNPEEESEPGNARSDDLGSYTGRGLGEETLPGNYPKLIPGWE